MGWSRDVFRVLWRALSKEVKQQVGTDRFGNRYYYIPEHKNWRAWIRKTRKTPPTMEEIMKSEKYREEIKMKDKDFYEEKKLLREESNKELVTPPVQTQIKGHASAPYFGREEPSVAPTSTGKTFQPGSWVPQDGKSHNQ
ncbi:NADH dehydrogenase [ubiquinone] 1 alpha subcomplex assembly factor 2 isoform X2 [Hippopotamus amphibius kiboko]|uniref:NADH dehydrogenase [ubiquinone] 1 alpha subcomplex assembly factor 2 isoform X2 n=1 Tax=Hippopotamus amphibius kiboko TaxID=575201 RepID=UPI0025971FAE|nr:NADH dehydrogenase [ubiquinone] 1 alpha subcomplex assembly factor 2 isoform X2 [Hippopotamus amphibius kiboko]